MRNCVRVAIFRHFSSSVTFSALNQVRHRRDRAHHAPENRSKVWFDRGRLIFALSIFFFREQKTKTESDKKLNVKHRTSVTGSRLGVNADQNLNL